MAEFGENLKRVREEKGITQQTLAEHLYVTRQAVSRWEGGSRYPDIMTAKKMAQFLDVTLDELLSDDDMKLYVERNSILDSSMAKRVQIVLLSLAWTCSFTLSIIYLCHYFIQDMLVLESTSEMTKHIMLTVVLGYGVYAAIYDRLNPKIASVIATLYIGTGILSGVVCLIGPYEGISKGTLLGLTALNIVFLGICIRFFCSKKNISPVSLYIVAAIYGVSCIANFFIGLMADIPIEIYRDVFMLNIFALIGGLLLLTLLVVMAYILNRKRMCAAR